MPLLRPTIIFTVIISTIGGLQLFTEPLHVRLRPASAAARNDEFQTLAMYMYEQAFTGNFSYGYGAAVAWLLFLMIIVFALVNFLLVRRSEGGRSDDHADRPGAGLRSRGGPRRVAPAPALGSQPADLPRADRRRRALDLPDLVWSFIVASQRQQRRSTTMPPPLTPGAAASATTSHRVLANEDADFLYGLVELVHRLGRA